MIKEYFSLLHRHIRINPNKGRTTSQARRLFKWAFAHFEHSNYERDPIFN